MTKRFRVAITVFADVEATSDSDAEQIAGLTIRRQLSGDERPKALPYPLPPFVLNRGTDYELPLGTVTVHQIMETGLAVGNGHLWLRPTAKPFTGDI